jgi:hypothetical protein
MKDAVQVKRDGNFNDAGLLGGHGMVISEHRHEVKRRKAKRGEGRERGPRWTDRFQIKDEIKAARIEATKAYRQYVEEPKTSQRR